jgi:hypothetical protein
LNADALSLETVSATETAADFQIGDPEKDCLFARGSRSIDKGFRVTIHSRSKHKWMDEKLSLPNKINNLLKKPQKNLAIC